jgi:CheY-like chemotaxis protein
MMMPHLEGLDIVRYMRTEKRLQRIPVINLICLGQELEQVLRVFLAERHRRLQ